MEAQVRCLIQGVDVAVVVNMVLINIILDVVGDLTKRQTLDELKKVNSACVLPIF